MGAKTSVVFIILFSKWFTTSKKNFLQLQVEFEFHLDASEQHTRKEVS